MVASGPAASVSCHWSNSVNTIVNVLLEMEHEEMELNFHVGDALVALGRDALGTSETAHNPPQDRVLLERVLSRGDDSRHLKQRRKATILLLCMCAVGLTTVRTSPSWKLVFQSPSVVVNLFSNWPADIVNGKISRELQARALEIPIRHDVRKVFFCVPLLMRVCSDRENIEVKTYWELEDDNQAPVRSVGGDTSSDETRADDTMDECSLVWR
ncbi:hypothetical protein PsorP6_014444 [Peronosclerospora sorghi]|uniref:Uncharacterized protein n=1 Tax=Peronosclerospora sorghi TaxID=230839 RepID=A0ACC0VG13_9STRA|nr:hypothetical protein PsorP6_014444 [Peronosclerospora sorghi]